MVVTDTRQRRQQRGRRGSADGQIVGGLLVLGGVAWFLRQTGLVDLSVATTLSALLTALGIGLVVTARRAGGVGLVAIGLLLTVVLASTSAVDIGLLQRGVGDRTYRPTTAADIAASYQLGIGSLTLDLTALEPSTIDADDVRIRVGIGEVIVLLPPATVVPVEVVAEARAGQVELFRSGEDDGGTNVRETFEDPIPAEGDRLGLDLDVAVGSIQVLRPRR
jgi:hypothetical protein